MRLSARYHFHRIMYRVHGRLKELRNHPDPLEVVAEDLAREFERTRSRLREMQSHEYLAAAHLP